MEGKVTSRVLVLLLLAISAVPLCCAQGPGSGSTSGGSGSASCPVSTASQQISLHIPDESVPPGAIVQMKVLVTEPTPISSGGPVVRRPAGAAVRGIELFNPTGDVNGVAMVGASQVSIAYITSSGAQGTDYPILTMALEIPSTVPVGAQLAFGIDPSSTWTLGLLGTATLKPISPATINVRGSIAINDIVPGEGSLPAGAIIQVFGVGFQSATQLQVSGFNASSYSVVSPNEIQIVLAQPTDIAGKKLQVTNPDGSLASYYAYLRGKPLVQSARPLLASALPIFSSQKHSQATFSAGTGTSTQFSGIALQNNNLSPATVTFTLYSASNQAISSSTLVVPFGYRLMQETSELAQGVAPQPGSYMTVSSDLPVQTFGFMGDDLAGTVVPFAPLASQP